MQRFAKVFTHFAQISTDSTRILGDFARIFTKSKVLGVRLQPSDVISYTSGCHTAGNWLTLVILGLFTEKLIVRTFILSGPSTYRAGDDVYLLYPPLVGPEGSGEIIVAE